jgi:hypothetical protein
MSDCEAKKGRVEAFIDIVWEALKSILGGLFGGATALAAQNGGYNFLTTGVIGIIVLSAVVAFCIVGAIKRGLKTGWWIFDNIE